MTVDRDALDTITAGVLRLAEGAIKKLADQNTELRREITAYQIAKDNLELRVREEAESCANDRGFSLPESAFETPYPAQVY